LKTIYQSATVLEAEQALDTFDKKWGEKYPMIVKQWRLHWSDIIAMFEFPPAIRKAIYTTNAIESVNSVIRKFTRNRKQYPDRRPIYSAGLCDLTRLIEAADRGDRHAADRGGDGSPEAADQARVGPSAGPGRSADPPAAGRAARAGRGPRPPGAA
jgi:hypothetical protein